MKKLILSVLAATFLFTGTAHAKRPALSPLPRPVPVVQKNHIWCYVYGSSSANYQIYVGFADSIGKAAVRIDRVTSSGTQTINQFSAARDYNVALNDEAYVASAFDLVVHTQTYTPDMMNIAGDFTGVIDGLGFSDNLVYCGVAYQ